MKRKESKEQSGERSEQKSERTSSINTDPFGSYTGVDTENENEIPVQDVDDL
jgi:hypothetical protein